MIHQFREIFHSLPERGELDRNHFEPIIKVIPEFSGFDHSFQIAMGRRDQPDIRFFGLIRTHGLKFTFLQNPQEFDLKGGRNVPDLVQKQSPAAGFLKKPLFIANRPGKGTFHVSKKLGLKQVLGQRPAVHGHEFLIFARAVFVNRAGHQFFSRAAFAHH